MQAKSLLKVKGEDTFLDLIAQQVISMRKDFGQPVKFMFMNSFATSADTMEYLQKYPEILSDQLEFVQNKVICTPHSWNLITLPPAIRASVPAGAQDYPRHP